MESDSGEKRMKLGVFRDINGTMIHLHNILEMQVRKIELIYD